jgi:hypothetical protein
LIVGGQNRAGRVARRELACSEPACDERPMADDGRHPGAQRVDRLAVAQLACAAVGVDHDGRAARGGKHGDRERTKIG